MATSGVVGIATTTYSKITFEWSVTQSVDGNYSTFTGEYFVENIFSDTTGFVCEFYKKSYIYVTDTDSGVTWRATPTFSKRVATVDGGGKISLGLQINIAKIPHNIDGTKNLQFDLYIYYAEAFAAGAVTSRTITSTATLTQINRYTDILTANNFTDEESPTITYSAYNKDTITALQAAISFDGYTDDIAYRDIAVNGTSYTFNFTDAEKEIMWQKVQGSTQAQIYFLVKTTRTGTENGQANSEIVTKTFTAKLSRYLTITDCIPVLIPVVRDVNEKTIALTGNDEILIKYHSNAQAVMNLWMQKGATIKDYYIKNGSNKVKETTYTFNGASYNVFEFYVIDSRNEYNTGSRTLQMVDYIKLTCNLKDNKPNAQGAVSIECNGNYFNDSFGAATNALIVQYRYKEQNGEFSAWADMTTTINGNTYEAIADITGLDYQKTYVFETKATDLLMSASSGETSVKSLPVFHWSGKDFVHETPVQFNDVITGDVQITGNLRLKAPDANYGNKIYLGDSSYVSISEDSDDDLTIDATTLSLSAQNISLGSQTDIYGGLSLNGGSVEFGTWTPTLNTSAAVSSYEVQNGWYMKLGACATIGFNIKASIKSGYNSTSLSIGGVPFTPNNDAFGGGVAFNIYISGGFNFECWAINTSGNISARLQPCNNTSAGNLNISSTAYYPSGGGTVTLGGTICYTTSI